jgi:hypothetical protein
MAMQRSDTTLYTPTEAAVLTRLPLKAVNNAIDKKTVRTVAGERSGRATRRLDAEALVSLAGLACGSSLTDAVAEFAGVAVRGRAR